jgi:hypothetical protein
MLLLLLQQLLRVFVVPFRRRGPDAAVGGLVVDA